MFASNHAMTTLEILLAARALHASGPKRWTQGSFARNRHGRTARTHAEEASWCMAGAIDRVVSGAVQWNESLNTERFVRDACGLESLTRFNDDPTTTYEMVMLAWDRAIEKARKA
jgi:hypothetical protein